MTPKQELAVLQQYQRIYSSPSDSQRSYRRTANWMRFYALVAFLVAILVVVKFPEFQIFCHFILVISGFYFGYAKLFKVSADQLPLILQFLSLNAEQVQSRIDELSGTSDIPR